VTEPGLPSGIVTFLFTDIEGSTELLRQLGSGRALPRFACWVELGRPNGAALEAEPLQ